HLTVPDISHEGVAEALTADRVLERTALLHVRVHRLRGATVAQASIRHAVGSAQITEIADPLARTIDRLAGHGPFDLYDLERKAGGRGAQVSIDTDRLLLGLLEHTILVVLA